MQLLGIDPINPDAKALQRNMNPQALLKFAANKIQAVRGQLSTVLGTPNASQTAFFVKWFPSYVNDCIWSLEMIDTVIGAANYRGAFRANAAENDSNMDVAYEDFDRASKSIIDSVKQVAIATFNVWITSKGGRPVGSALITQNEAKIMEGASPATFAANRDIKRNAILTKQELSERSAVLRKIAPGVKPEQTLLQYATGGSGQKSSGIINPMEAATDGPIAPKKPINPLVIAGVAVAGYFAYKSLA